MYWVCRQRRFEAFKCGNVVSEQERAKLLAILDRIPEQERELREVKREIFRFFKETNRPQKEIVKDGAEVMRLQQLHRIETRALQGRVERLQGKVKGEQKQPAAARNFRRVRNMNDSTERSHDSSRVGSEFRNALVLLYKPRNFADIRMG